MTDYLEYVDRLVSEGKTSGENQDENMIKYTEMALRRMKRWDKIGELIPEMIEKLNQIDTKQNWIVITEAWCGDAAHAYMFIEKMADANPNISLEWKLRDENPDLMNLFLTNGGKAIPKVIAYDNHGNELWNWGPRPKHIQDTYWRMRKEDVPYKEVMIEVQKLYNENKGQTMQIEILDLMNKQQDAKRA